jgi:glycosyltransferase involved in cell wall biosynthesis
VASKTLHLFTAEFPHGIKSEPFLETELTYLAGAFEDARIYPSHIVRNKRFTPKNFVIDNSLGLINALRRKKISAVLRNPILTFRIFRSEIEDKGVKKVFQNYKVLFDILAREILKFETLRKSNRFNTIDIYYDYWYINSGLSLAIAKHKKLIQHNIVRTHRYDLYDEEWGSLGVPFRRFIGQNTSTITFISESGLQYFNQRTRGNFRNKLEIYRLGIKSIGNQVTKKKSQIYHLVSCSGVTKRKNILEIARLLEGVSAEIKWIHFGDGPLFEELKELVKTLPKNIDVNLKGHCKNAEVMDFYKKNFVDGFISLSNSEGVPVSMMEAIAHGIPIFAKDVGGISEIVKPNLTGMLVNDSVSVNEQFEEFLFTSFDREAIQLFQKAHFDAEKNYTIFVENLMLRL